MKVCEILDPIHNKHDTNDILKNDKVYYLDKYYDILENLTNKFTIPSSWLYSHEVDIVKDWVNENQDSIFGSFHEHTNRWNIKLNKLKKYFDIP